MFVSSTHAVVLALAFFFASNVIALPVQTDHERPSYTSSSINARGPDLSETAVVALNTFIEHPGAVHRSMEIQDSSLKERGIVGAVVDAVKGIASLIQKIIEKVKAKRRAKKERTDFAKSVVDQGRKDHPEFNWVICASKHSAEFKGTKGTDWDQLEKDVQVEGKTVKFTAYYGREGEFWDKGAKASSDWAYAGSYDIDRKSKGKHLIFKRPQ